MEIEIVRTEFNCLISQDKIFWKDYIKSHIRLFFILVIPGTLLLLDAIDQYTKTGSFGGLTFSLALGLFLSAILNITYQFLIRHKSLKKTKQIVALYKRQNESLVIRITGWGITTKGLDATSEFSWSYFKNYKISGDFLLLLPMHHSDQTLIFDKNEISIEKHDQLVLFLNNRFRKKK